ARRDHVVGADDVGEAVALAAAPGARLGGVVEHRVVAAHGGGHRPGVGEVATELAHADGVELRVVAAAEAGDLVAAFDQPPAQRLAEESAAAGDQDLHGARPGTRDSGLGRRLAAHAARRSRSILALWRMSTGKRGWKRKVSMAAVCAWRVAIARNSSSNWVRGFRRSRNSRMTTGRCPPLSPMPTRAARWTSGCAANTGSTCSV